MESRRSVSVSVDRSDPRSLPQQIADGLRRHIAHGLLTPGHRLPSSRALAQDLGVSRGVVDQAFDQLVAEGWIEGRAGSGTFVSVDAPSDPAIAPTPRSPQLSPVEEHGRLSLRAGIPWTPPTATASWRRAWRHVGTLPQPHSYPDPLGPTQFRVAVSDLLARVRSLRIPAERIVITTGAVHGLTLALSAIRTYAVAVDAKPVLAMEDPGYRAASSAARALGWDLHDVPVDAGGLRVDRLCEAPFATAAIYVTPSHQYPSGGTLDVARRAALLAYARESNSLVIEDDYDSEYRYDVAPLPALAMLDPERVVYLGTIAKTLGAGVRLGWMVVPAHLVDAVRTHRTATGDFPSDPLCAAVHALLLDGEWDRTVRSARRRYRERDAAVANSLARFGELRGLGAGMHTTLIISPERAAAVADAASDRGVDVATLAPSTRSHTDVGGLVIGYGRLDAADLDRALAVLVDALERYPD